MNRSEHRADYTCSRATATHRPAAGTNRGAREQAIGDTRRNLEETEAKARLEAHLATLGYSATQLVVDSTGTLTTLQPPSEGRAVALPVLRTKESASGPADINVTSVLGEGGMGRVMAATQVALGREVAVKVLRNEADPRASADLLREAMVAGRLEHPNIVPVYLLGTTPEGAPLFVMRRIAGVPWSRVLSEMSAAPAFFATASADPLGFQLSIFSRVCEAVHFAHSKGIVHRDLKPDNVMLGEFGEVYVVDWGLAVSLEDDTALPRARDAKALAGTPRYMAPEMIACDAAALSARTDVFLLGAILYEIVTGRAPFDAPSVLEQLVRAFDCAPPPVGEEASPELARIVQRALARSPSDRYASVDELRRAVLDFAQHRASYALSTEAAARGAELFALLDAPSDARSDASSPRVQELFTECRFGYLQALKAWSHNDEAKAGLKRALERMIEHELARDNARGASELLAQLTEANPELARRVRDAQERTVADRARIDALEAFRKDADTDSATSARVKMLFGGGLFWAVLSSIAGVLDWKGLWPFTYREAMAAIALNGAITVWMRSHILRTQSPNAAVRRLLDTSTLLGIGLFSHWVLAWALGTRLEHALVTFLWWVAGGWICVGLLFDRKIVLTGIAFGAGAIAVALWPALRIFIFGATCLIGYGALALAWHMDDRARRTVSEER